jgi:hypothetical protein
MAAADQRARTPGRGTPGESGPRRGLRGRAGTRSGRAHEKDHPHRCRRLSSRRRHQVRPGRRGGRTRPPTALNSVQSKTDAAAEAAIAESVAVPPPTRFRRHALDGLLGRVGQSGDGSRTWSPKTSSRRPARARPTSSSDTPGGVHVGGVDDVDPGVEGAVHDADGVGVVVVAPRAEQHRPQPEEADLDAGAAERSVLGGNSSTG